MRARSTLTDNKVGGLFRAPSPDVSDQTFPGPEYDFFLWGEQNPLPARSSPGIFEDSFGVPVPMLEFSKKFYFPSLEYSKIVRCTCSQTGVFREMFSFPAWNYPGFPGISKQEKSASSWIRSDDLLNIEQMSYLFTTSSVLLQRILF
jgi:hypothetical protein